MGGAAELKANVFPTNNAKYLDATSQKRMSYIQDYMSIGSKPESNTS